MRVVVVGAGIGGLAAALSLHEAGIEARVFEAAVVGQVRALLRQPEVWWAPGSRRGAKRRT